MVTKHIEWAIIYRFLIHKPTTFHDLVVTEVAAAFAVVVDMVVVVLVVVVDSCCFKHLQPCPDVCEKTATKLLLVVYYSEGHFNFWPAKHVQPSLAAAAAAAAAAPAAAPAAAAPAAAAPAASCVG